MRPRKRTQIRPLTLDYPDITLDDAYAIQQAWVDKKIETGDRITGYKIGLTSKAMQQAMNIDTPDFGILLSSMAYDNGAEIDAEQFSDPRVEVELAFIIRDHLAGEAVFVEEVLAAMVRGPYRTHRCAELQNGSGNRLYRKFSIPSQTTPPMQGTPWATSVTTQRH